MTGSTALGIAAATAVGVALITAPAASASPASLCDGMGGTWNGTHCHASVLSDRKAVREINIAIPAEVGNPVIGAAIADYVTALMNNWRRAAQGMNANSWGDANFTVFRHGDIHTVVFHETYDYEGTARLEGAAVNDAYRTFAFDSAAGRQVQLADVVDVAAIPTLGAPYIQAALDAAPPAHQPGTYPFTADRWTPDKVFSGGYRAWALTPDELILYLPDYPVARDSPIDFTPATFLWSMNGGVVQPRIPLSALGTALRV